jgi:hypothetical protein
MDNPSVVIAVILNEPQVAARDGGQVAAPIFREIAEKILPELEVAKDGTVPIEIPKDTAQNKEVKPNGNEKAADKKSVEKIEKSEDSVSPKLNKDGSLESKNITVPKPKTALPETKPKNKSSGKGKT